MEFVNSYLGKFQPICDSGVYDTRYNLRLMSTPSFFGDKEMKESLDREGRAVWALGLLADAGSYLIVTSVLSFLERIL